MLCGKIFLFSFSYHIRFLLFVIFIMKTTASRNASGGCRAFDRQTRGNWKNPLTEKNTFFVRLCFYLYFFCGLMRLFNLFEKIIYTIICMNK